MADPTELTAAQKQAQAIRDLAAANLELREIKKELAAYTDQELKDMAEHLDKGGKATKAIQAETAARVLRADALQKHVQYAQRDLENAKDQLDMDKRQLELNNARIEQLKELMRVNAENRDGHLKEIEQLREQNKELDENIGRLQSKTAAVADLTKSVATLFDASKITPTSLFNPRNLITIGKGFQGLKDAMADGAAGKKKFQNMFKRAAIDALLAYSDAIVKLTVELADMENKFRRATGADDDFARSLTQTYAQVREYGIKASDAADSAQALYTTFTDFTFASEAERESLNETGAILEKLGISHADFATSIQTSTKAMGMSTEQAGQTMLDLEKFARELGVAPQAMARDCAGATDMLAKMGDQGNRTFKELQAVMKITGLEMQKILTLTDKFDTFEGAAEMAGKLNAALGGNFVNAMDMMTATEPAERFGMIRDSILDAGLSFDTMDYYQKKFYASAMGLTDVNDLSLILSGNMESVEGATQKTSQEIEEAANRARDLASIQDKLTAAFMQLIPVLTPLIDGLGSIATWLAKNMDIIKPFLGLVITLASAFMLWTGAGTAGGIAGVTLGLSMLFDSFEVGEEKMSGLAIVLKPFIAIVSGLAKLIWFIVEPIVVLASNIYKWLEATGYLETAIHGLMVVGLALLVMFFWPAIAAFLAAKLGLMLIVGAVTAVTAAFSKLARVVFKESFASTFLEGLVKLAYAFGEIAVRVIEVMNPINQIRLLIESLGTAIGTVLTGITGFFTALTSKDAADNIVKIGKAISAIPMKKNLEFVASMGSAAHAATAATAARSAVTAATAPAAAASGGSGPMTVTVQLDGPATRDLLKGAAATVVGKVTKNAALGVPSRSGFGPSPDFG